MKELNDVNLRALATPPTKKEGFLDRMREVAVALGYRSLTSFQAALGFTNGYFRAVGRLNREAEARILARHPNVNIDYLRTGEGELLKEEVKKYDGVYIPLLPVSAQGGSLNDFDPSVPGYECEMIVSPIKDVSLALTVSGDSMSPDYPSGCTIFVQKIEEEAFIEWGRTYVLDTINGTVIKNIYPCDTDDDKVICRSINPNYPEFFLAKEYIRGWYRVRLQMTLK